MNEWKWSLKYEISNHELHERSKQGDGTHRRIRPTHHCFAKNHFLLHGITLSVGTETSWNLIMDGAEAPGGGTDPTRIHSAEIYSTKHIRRSGTFWGIRFEFRTSGDRDSSRHSNEHRIV